MFHHFLKLKCKYANIYITYLQDGFDKGKFTPATKNVCINVVFNVIQGSPNMEQVRTPETQENNISSTR